MATAWPSSSSPRHPLAGAERVSIRDLGKELFIAHNVASPLRRKVIEAFQRYRTPLNMDIELPTIEAIKRFVAMGNGVALVPHLTVARELETGDLVRVTVDELDVRRVLRLAHRRQATLSYAPRPFCTRSEPWPRSRDRRSSTMWSEQVEDRRLRKIDLRIHWPLLASRVYSLSFHPGVYWLQFCAGSTDAAATRSGHLQF